MLKIKRADLDQIYAHALGDYPSECCGILTVGAGESVSKIHPCRNIQDQLHGQDPESYPRDSSTAYCIDPQELYEVGSSAEKSGGRISGFYHSHIDCDAYFSEEDRERAMVWDEPAYADAIYLVISVRGRKIIGYKCFGWVESSRNFAEADLQIID